jgi:hypothetical protein
MADLSPFQSCGAAFDEIWRIFTFVASSEVQLLLVILVAAGRAFRRALRQLLRSPVREKQEFAATLIVFCAILAAGGLSMLAKTAPVLTIKSCVLTGVKK